MRANNYWDNFRSFSRQNRFTSTPAAVNPTPPLNRAAVVSNGGDQAEAVAAAAAAAAVADRVIAQVTPRQLQADSRQGSGRSAAVMPRSGSGRHSALVEPYFSNINSPSR